MCDSAKTTTKSRPQGDEATLYVNSETNCPDETSLSCDFGKNFTEPILEHDPFTSPVYNIKEAIKGSEFHNERISTAYERAVDGEDISEITEDIDTSLCELRSLEEEINSGHTISPISVSVLDRTENLTGELVSQTYDSRPRRNISSRIEELSRSFSVSQESEHYSPFTRLKILPAIKYQSATFSTVRERRSERSFAFRSRLGISAPSYATPLPKMILGAVSIRSLTEGGNLNSAHRTQGAIPSNGSRSFTGNALHVCANIKDDIAYYPIDLGNHEGERNDETEVYQLHSESVSLDWNVAQTMNEPSESLPPYGNCETIASDMTLPSISRVPISNSTRSSRYYEANTHFNSTDRSSANRVNIDNRGLILKWTLVNTLILSAYGAFRSYYAKLTLGDMYSIGGYLLGLCIVVLIVFVRTGRTS